MILPNYNSGSIVNLVSSILSSYGLKNIYNPLENFNLPNHKNVVFIVIDGLGLDFLQNHGKNSFFLQKTITSVTSVFPSTTAAALTSLMTGVAPLQHALTGWFMYFRELAVAGVPIQFAPRFTDKSFTDFDIDINDIFNYEPIFNRITCGNPSAA